MIQQNFEDRDGWIWRDGKLVPWRAASLHVLSHGLHYAAAAFEGQRAYDGVIFRLTEHSQRLKRSAELLGYEIPWSVAEIDAACNAVVAANKLRDAYVRPIAWRGSEQMGVSAQSARVHLAIGAWKWGAYFGEESLNRGAVLDVSEWRRPAPYTAPTQAKASGLYMICTMAKNRAESRGCTEALMLDWRGQVAEATSANIFFVRGGELFTPTPDCFLDGITRRTVMDLAQHRGLKVTERAIWPEELESFEQCFLTGSAAEVTPVAKIGPWSFEVGDLTRQFARDYSVLVRSASRTELSNAA
jgi:branched-chain amino acid aminotransferase